MISHGPLKIINYLTRDICHMMRWTPLSNRRGPGLLVLRNVLFTQKKKKATLFQLPLLSLFLLVDTLCLLKIFSISYM